MPQRYVHQVKTVWKGKPPLRYQVEQKLCGSYPGVRTRTTRDKAETTCPKCLELLPPEPPAQPADYTSVYAYTPQISQPYPWPKQ